MDMDNAQAIASFVQLGFVRDYAGFVILNKFGQLLNACLYFLELSSTDFRMVNVNDWLVLGHDLSFFRKRF